MIEAKRRCFRNAWRTGSIRTRSGISGWVIGLLIRRHAGAERRAANDDHKAWFSAAGEEAHEATPIYYRDGMHGGRVVVPLPIARGPVSNVDASASRNR